MKVQELGWILDRVLLEVYKRRETNFVRNGVGVG